MIEERDFAGARKKLGGEGPFRFMSALEVAIGG